MFVAFLLLAAGILLLNSAVIDLKKETANMALSLAELKEKLSAAIDEIAKDIADLKDAVANGIPPADVEAAFAPLITKLEELGAPLHESEPPVEE